MLKTSILSSLNSVHQPNILKTLHSRHLLNIIILKCQIHTHLNNLTASKKTPDEHHIQVSRSTEKKCQKKFNLKKFYQLLHEYYNSVTTKKDFSFKWKINFTFKAIFLKELTLPPCPPSSPVFLTNKIFPHAESRRQTHPWQTAIGTGIR